jgi:hypothetical protein
VHPLTEAQSAVDLNSTAKLVKLQCGPKYVLGYIQLISNVSVELDVGCVTVGFGGLSARVGMVTSAALTSDHSELVS